MKITGHSENHNARQNPNEVSQSANYIREKLEILMCFDSNGKYLDRKKLWKVKDSEFKTCSTQRIAANKQLPNQGVKLYFD